MKNFLLAVLVVIGLSGCVVDPYYQPVVYTGVYSPYYTPYYCCSVYVHGQYRYYHGGYSHHR